MGVRRQQEPAKRNVKNRDRFDSVSFASDATTRERGVRDGKVTDDAQSSQERLRWVGIEPG